MKGEKTSCLRCQWLKSKREELRLIQVMEICFWVITVASQLSLTLCFLLLLEHPAQLIMARLVRYIYSGNLTL